MTIRHNILSAVALSGIIFASHAGVSHAGEANNETFELRLGQASQSAMTFKTSEHRCFGQERATRSVSSAKPTPRPSASSSTAATLKFEGINASRSSMIDCALSQDVSRPIENQAMDFRGLPG